MARPAVVVALPPGESVYVCAELAEAGFDVIEVLDAVDSSARSIAVATSAWPSSMARSTTTTPGTSSPSSVPPVTPIASLTVVSPRALERFAALETAGTDDEYFTRPYSADSIRWRVEAMCIRRETVDDGSGPVLRGGDAGMGGWNKRATTVAVFNPKGGVGKTTIATNLAVSAPDAQGQVGPPHRRRHGHRSRDDVPWHRRGPDRRRRVAGRSRRRAGRRPAQHRVRSLVRDEGRRPDQFATEHRRPRPDPAGRSHRRRTAVRRRHRARRPSLVQHASTRRSSTRRTGSSCRSLRTSPRSAQRSSSATSRTASAVVSAWR